MRYSGNIRKNLEYLNINFNEDAVVILTKQNIPIQLKFVASLGNSFNYCKPIDDYSMIDALICMKKVASHCDRYEEFFDVNHRLNLIKNQMFDGNLPLEMPTESQSYIYHLMMQANEFLCKNKNIIVIPSDKGGKVVIMDRDQYMKKANAYLDENVIAGNYERVYDDYLNSIRPMIEQRYINIISKMNPFLKAECNLKEPLCPEPYIIPLFYGCPKIHKENAPLRPIISSADMIGNFISLWLLEKLRLISCHLNDFNAKSSSACVMELKNFKMEPDHRLCSFDYVSMFTNVDIDETSAIIFEHYHLISRSTSVPVNIFMECLNLYIKEATYFLFDGKIYKQSKGLAMGNRLAQELADIRTNYALTVSVKKFGADFISFLYKYVDDIFSSIHTDYIDSVKNEISKDVGMELTLTNEDQNYVVEFLDCKFKRNLDASVSTQWLKKDYSCLSILNFHSYHPWAVKYNVVVEMIKKAFAITSPELIDCTKELLSDILKRSSYPEWFIIDNIYVLHPVLNFDKVNPLNEFDKVNRMNKYIACPYYIPLFNDINSIIKYNKMKIKLAPRPTTSNRRILFSKIKDNKNNSLMKNVIMKISCSNCSYAYISTTKNFDVQRTIDYIKNDGNSPWAEHVKLFPGHLLNDSVDIIKNFNNQYDVQWSKFVLNDIKKFT